MIRRYSRFSRIANDYREVTEDIDVQILLKDIRKTLTSDSEVDDEFFDILDRLDKNTITSNEAHRLYFVLNALFLKYKALLNPIQIIQKKYQKFMNR